MAEVSLTRTWVVVILLTLCNAFSLVDRQIISLMVEPLKVDRGLSDVQISLLQGPAFAFLYAISGIPFGRLADITDRRRLIAGAIICWSAFTAAFGLARNYAMMLAARVGVGIGEAALTPAAYSLLSDLFDKNRLGRALATFGFGAFLGSSLGLIAGGAIYGFVAARGSIEFGFIGRLEPWQMTFVAVALPGALLSAAVLVALPRMGSGQSQSLAVRRGSIAPVFTYIRQNRKFYVPAFLAYACHAIIMNGFFQWTATYLIRSFGVTPAEAGRVFGLVLFGTCLFPIFGGWLADRLYARRGVLAGLDIMLVLFIMTGVAALFAFRASELGLATVGITAIAVTSVTKSVLVPLSVQAASPPQMRGMMAAITLLCGTLAGGGLGPVSVAVLNQYVFPAEGVATSLAWHVFFWSVVGTAMCLTVRRSVQP